VHADATEEERPRSLPVLQGAEHLRFHCTGCGVCCRTYRAAVTHHDLARLLGSIGARAQDLVEFLTPDAVDMTGEPETLVELGEGRRMMVLAQREGACRFLSAENRCTVYAVRPSDCRLFPFDLTATAESASLSLLPLEGCEFELSTDTDLEVEGRALVQDDATRSRELSEYRALVARWNQLAKRRRRFGHRVGGAAEFLAHLGFDP
jgi:Fe-S-cluster containining protein